MIRDLKFALRGLIKNPAFTVVAVFTLALGIAANTAIFSAVDAVLLHPLPFPHPEQLVDITKTMPMFELFKSISSGLDFLEYRAQSKAFSDMAGIEAGQFNLTGDRSPERVPGMRVSASLFGMLHVQPLMGRGFSAEEEQWGRNKVVILSDTLWRGRFGGDPQILGKQVQLDGENYTVVGIVRPMLAFYSGARLWTPLAYSPDQVAPNQRGHQNLYVVARLKPGIAMAQAAADLQRVTTQLTAQLPAWYPKGWSLDASPLAARVSGPIRTPLLVLLGSVALVLLIGCANVANLLLARASARQKEITIRTALGARRILIIRQLLLESGAIAVIAGGLGLLASIWVLDLFERIGPAGLLRGQHLSANLMVGGFTLLVSLLATILFGLAPAITVSKADLNDSLKESSRGASGSSSKQRLRAVLMASEVALSLTLLISAGLLIRSFQRLQEAGPGFDPQHLATFQLSLPAVDYKQPSKMADFYNQMLFRLASLPGVTAVGGVDPMPFSGSNRGGSFNIIGRPWPSTQAIPDVSYHRASPGYFQAMRIPVLRGRVFTEQDGIDAPKVAVVDEPFVRQFFPKEDPIGKQLSGPDQGGYTIVGVVGGTKNNNLSDPPVSTIYYAGLQAPFRAISFVLRTSGGDPLSLVPAVRREVQALDRNMPVYRPATMEERLSDSLARTRFSTTLLSVFAALALLLASIGIYGVISYIVSQRGQEIGIRMALGARPRDAVLLVLRQGATPVVVGIAAGFVASLGATRMLSSLLYGVSATDPVIFICLSLFLAGVALAACYIPARKATKVDPMIALRYE
ncbi:MAG TPA: ABC transporter permease [Bryobacteraceae bacterium]|nr:ABC transporter permease [Bryobacteraceae bacterium]